MTKAQAVVFLLSLTIWDGVSPDNLDSPLIKNHFLDKEKGLLTYNMGPALGYGSKIYIPLVVGLPTKLERSVEEMMSTENCDTLDVLEELMKDVGENIRQKLPDIQPITNKASLEDFLLVRGKLNLTTPHDQKMTKYSFIDEKRYMEKKGYIKAYKDKLKELNIIQTRSKLVDLSSNSSTKTDGTTISTRSKRFAWIPVVIIGVAATLGGLSIANRVEMYQMNKNTDILQRNQDIIASKLNEMSSGFNVIRDNQQNIIIMMDKFTEKMNQLIKDYNCHKINVHEQIKLINTWSSTAPNSFMRALNALIHNEINIDVIPGDYLKKIIQYYPAFTDTIFMHDPLLLYRSARAQILKLDKDNLQVDALITIPRIMMKPFGTLYGQSSCPWKSNEVWLKLKHSNRGILSNTQENWWSTRGCLTQEEVTLCDIQEMEESRVSCFSKGSNWNISRCPIEMIKHLDPFPVIQIKDGVVVCNKGERVTRFKRDGLGLIQTSLDTISGPTYYTSDDADAIMVGSYHYNLLHTGPVINVTYHYTSHLAENNSNLIDELDYHPSWKDTKNIEILPELQRVNTNHIIGLYVTIAFLIVGSFILGYWFYRKHNKTQKMIGFISSKFDKNLEIVTLEKDED